MAINHPTHESRIAAIELVIGQPQSKKWTFREVLALGVPVLALLFGILYFGLPRLLSHVERDRTEQVDGQIEAKFKDHHLDEIKSSVDQMTGQMKSLTDTVNLLLGKNLKQVGSLSLPELRRQLPQVQGILNAAIRSGAPVEIAAVHDLGNHLAALAGHDPAAWQATLSLASYRSIFNSMPEMGAVQRISDSGRVRVYEVTPPAGEEETVLSAPPVAVASSSGAVFETIGSDPNPGNPKSNPFVIATGGGVLLDNCHIRNAVLTGVHVVYNGGPLIMENVTFINCTFSIQRSEAGELLASKSIDSERVSLQAT